MTSRRQHRPLTRGVPVLVFVVVLAALALVNRSSEPSRGANGGPAASADVGKHPRDVEALIGSLQDRVRAESGGAAAYAALGDAYLQRTRETGDPAFYLRANTAFDAALRRDSSDLTAVVGAGTLALARHDFRRGLALGLRARRLAPQTDRPFAVVVDAQLELGRYAQAERSLQAMVDRKPNLASYSRVSYYRELRGDLEGAVEAMSLAVSAGGGTPENVAFVQTLLGDLQLDRGNVRGARRAYGAALAGAPGHAPAEAGLARVDVARGRLARAERRLRGVSERLPLPTYVIALAEVELARGRRQQARDDLEVVRLQRQLLEQAGTQADVDLVLFEADHGSAARGVRLGREVLSSAPSVRSEDALGWALTRAGAPERGLEHSLRALRLGSVDPAFHYHAGMAAKASGRAGLARTELREALSLNPSFSPFHAQRARRALRELS